SRRALGRDRHLAVPRVRGEPDPGMSTTTPEIEPARILVVDDRVENLQALEAVLEPLGRPVVTAGSGREALRLLLDQQFAVILLDVQMPEMDGFALVARRQENDARVVAAVAHENKDPAGALRELQGASITTDSLAAWVIEEPEARLFGEVDEEVWAELGLTDGGGLFGQLEPRCLIVAPLVLRGRTLGVIVLGRSRNESAYGDEELELAQDLARRSAMALENARLYEAERERSRTLQISLLGESVVENPAVTAAMRYLPGSAELEVGGDWYDVIERDDGRLVAVVGDVVGRGVQAATAMGKLRSAIAALALVVDGAPYILGQ